LLADFHGMGTPHVDDVDCSRFCASLRSNLAVLAADMPVKATKEARAVAEPECLRWVQSNYNYCDPFPTIRARRDTVGSSEGRIQDRAPADTLAAGFARP
jgi:hypothetical protein